MQSNGLLVVEKLLDELTYFDFIKLSKQTNNQIEFSLSSFPLLAETFPIHH